MTLIPNELLSRKLIFIANLVTHVLHNGIYTALFIFKFNQKKLMRYIYIAFKSSSRTKVTLEISSTIIKNNKMSLSNSLALKV